MQGSPEQNEREPAWVWPVVGLAGLLVLVVIAAIGASRPQVVTPVLTPPGVVARDSGIVIWLGALATLLLYSILYRENPYYRFAEHLFLGLAAGYGVYQIWSTNLFQNWYEPLFIRGQWLWTIAFVAGLMYFMVYSRRFSWMSRTVMMMILAFDAGSYFRLFAGDWISQIGDTFRPLVSPHPPYLLINNVIFVGAALAVMVYFLFSFEHRSRGLRYTATSGRWLMMIAFGAMFGSTVMARMSLFIGRLSYMFQDWIHLIPRT
jgi:hypothetical protein